MGQIIWKPFTSISSQARMAATRYANTLDQLRRNSGLGMLRKLWTDGTFMFSAVVSDDRIVIAVWGGETISLRFWVYADGVAYGVFYDGTTWSKAELIIQGDGDLHDGIPTPFNYSWTNGKYFLYSVGNVTAPTRLFWHRFDFFTGNYARIGSSGYIDRDNGITPRRNIEVVITGKITDAYDFTGRDRGVPVAILPPDPDAYTTVAYPDVTVNPSSGYVLNTGQYVNGGLLDPLGPAAVSGLYDTGALLLGLTGIRSALQFDNVGGEFWSDAHAYEYDYALAYIQEVRYTVTYPVSWPLPYWDPLTTPPFPTRFLVYGTFNVSSSDGLRIPVLFTPHADYGGSVGILPTASGIWSLLTYDHGAVTAVVTELEPLYTKETVTTYSQNGTFPGTEPGTIPSTSTYEKTNIATSTLNGYDFDNADVLKLSKIVEVIDRLDEYSETWSSDGGDPPTVSLSSIGKTTLNKDLELWVDGVKVWSYAQAEGISDSIDGANTFYTIGGALTLTVNDIDIASDSWSFSIVDIAQSHDGVTTLTETFNFKEYTRTSGVDQTTITDSAVQTSVVPIASMPYYRLDHSSIGGTNTTVTIDHEPLSTTEKFPQPQMNVKLYGDGMRYRFLTDRDGNTLSLCPTGQESYWEMDGDNADVAPSKWITTRPAVFTLYDSTGTVVDLSHFGFTDVESIGVCDGLVE